MARTNQNYNGLKGIKKTNLLFQDCIKMECIVEKVIKMQVVDLRSNPVVNQDSKL